MSSIESVYLESPVTGLLGTELAGTDCILVGQGSWIHLLQTDSTVRQRLRVFAGSNVHGIKRFCEEVLVTGGKEVSSLSIKDGNLVIKTGETRLEDWIWDVHKVEDKYYFLTAHNKVLQTDARFGVLNRFGCEEKCILYSGLLQPTSRELCVLAGSVFSEVLIWSLDPRSSPSKETSEDSPVLHRNSFYTLISLQSKILLTFVLVFKIILIS